MKERDAARLFEDILSGKGALEAGVPEEVQAALEMARRMEASNPSDASNKGMANLGRLMARHPARSRPASRPYGRMALQGMAAFIVLAAVGLLFSRLMTVILRPATAAPMVAMAPAAQATQPGPTPISTQAAVAQPVTPAPLATSAPSVAEQQPTSEPLVVSMAQAVEQIPFPVLAPADNTTPLELESVQIPAEQDDSNTIIQTYNSPQGDVTITQSRADDAQAPQEPTPTETTTTEANPTETTTATVNVRGQTGYLSATDSGETALTWTENNTDITISGKLPEEQLVMLAQNLKPQEPSGQPVTIDCDTTFPGLPGCQSTEPLAFGRLVFVDPRPAFNNRPYVADLQTGDGWPAGEAPGQPAGFSPSGRYLLIHASNGSWLVFDTNGKRALKLPGGQDSPAIDPFWLPQDTLKPGGDWLAAPTQNGGLEAYALPTGKTTPLLPDGTFTAAAGKPVVSTGGWIAWISNPAPQKDGPTAQTLMVAPLAKPEEIRSMALSADIQKDGAFRLLDWAPGTRTLLLGGPVQAGGGLPLYSFNINSGQLTRLPGLMLNTHEAYDWNPVKPGLMALAEGDGASIASNKRLALLNVNTGAITYLILNEQSAPLDNFVAFQPKWSPDGRYVAFAGLQIAGGTDRTAENALLGRSIWIADTTTAPVTSWTVTAAQPGEDRQWVDGWPQWSQDGTKLLYTRQKGGKTDVRVHDLQTGKDNLLITGLPNPACLIGGCDWSTMLLYTPKSVQPPATQTPAEDTQALTPTQPAPTPPPTATPTPVEWSITAQLQAPEGSEESRQTWVAASLFDMWLKTFTVVGNPSVPDTQRLEEYQVNAAAPLPGITSNSNAPALSFYAQVTFAVKPAPGEGSIWIVGSAPGEDGWINGLQRNVGVLKEGDLYKLYVLP